MESEIEQEIIVQIQEIPTLNVVLETINMESEIETINMEV